MARQREELGSKEEYDPQVGIAASERSHDVTEVATGNGLTPVSRPGTPPRSCTIWEEWEAQLVGQDA